MCRWMAYSGNPILLEDLLFNVKHSLIDQSMSSKSRETPTNGDGFGIGWYGARPQPGLFHSIRPAWNDFNLRDLAAQIESPLFIAHVRATSAATIQETNCHPYRWKNWLFAHNGEIHEIEKSKRDLLFAVAPEYFNNIQGTTDSELMFHLALTFGLERDPLGAVERMAGFVEETARRNGVEESLWMTLAFSEGKNLYAVRYASDGDAPTLFYTRDIEDIARLNPQHREGLKERFGDCFRLVVSEPMGGLADAWVEVPQATALIVSGDDVRTQPFKPAPPRLENESARKSIA